MTAEVAIANGSAVALAADSAVTIGGRKIYNSAIKLFSLSKVEPVGIMIYGNANLLEVPWETIIKTCRDSLGSNKYQHLEEYGEYFINYIKEHSQYFSDLSQKNWVRTNVQAYYEMLRDQLDEKIRLILQEKSEIDADTIHSLFEDIINEYHNYLNNMKIMVDGDINFEQETKEKYRATFKEVYDGVFENLKIESTLMSKLEDIATFRHTREIYSNGTSGVVIAGFGDDEIYPSILTYEIEGYFDGRLKFRRLENKCYKVTSGNDCSIIAFAQEDMVHSFMKGMNPSVNNLMGTYLKRIFDRLPELLTDEELKGSQFPAQQIRNNLKDSADKLLNDFMIELENHINENHISPVLNMVTALPKDELAAMAESLVNLTAFKRKMTESLETVGGPIDVVVISKGDGLVWVKRKLYFPKELNHNFFQNYFRGVDNV